MASNYTISYVAGTLTVGQAGADDHRERCQPPVRGDEPGVYRELYGPRRRRYQQRGQRLTLSTAATTGSSVGSYAITALGAMASNYAITEVNGTLTVGQAALTITANDASPDVWFATNPTFTASYNGFGGRRYQQRGKRGLASEYGGYDRQQRRYLRDQWHGCGGQ